MPLHEGELQKIRLSSNGTYFYKKVFPVLLFGTMAALVLICVFGGWDVDAQFVVIALATAALTYGLWISIIWNVVDEVYDCGDFLLVRNRGAEERLPLSAIADVADSVILWTQAVPPRVTLCLLTRQSRRRKIAFLAIRHELALGLAGPFARNAVAEYLIAKLRSKGP